MKKRSNLKDFILPDNGYKKEKKKKKKVFIFSHLQKSAQLDVSSAPNFFIVSANKSGQTVFLNILDKYFMFRPY